MKRTPLYSSARPTRPLSARAASSTGETSPSAPPATPEAAAPSSLPDTPPRRWQRLRTALGPALAGAAFVLLLLLAYRQFSPPPLEVTQADIDAAVRQSLQKEPLPSAAARAYDDVKSAIVRVRSVKRQTDPKTGQPGPLQEGTGTGVVIIDTGVILTNLHVVWEAEQVSVVFANGMETEAVVVNMRPQQDLAVLRVNRVPDDLDSARLGGTGKLRPGDQVIAVGYPFGFGPSVTAGVISGLGREFKAPEGIKPLTNLIQFDAAANPGNSGGPLVNMQGEVVGIVTSIFNPTRQGVFVGVAFAVPIEQAASAVGVPPF